jgi:5-methylcytosine-specific restriction endonuclease McrA
LRYREANGEALRDRARKLRQEQPDEVRAKGRREAQARALGQDVEAVEYAAILRRDPCSYCGARGGQVDHVVPLAEGGENRAMNLTSACETCNPAKGAKPLLLFLAT